jgi:hypothetical protein
MPNKVARVLYFSRSAFVLYSRTSSSSEIVVDIDGSDVTCDLSSHCSSFLGYLNQGWNLDASLMAEA